MTAQQLTLCILAVLCDVACSQWLSDQTDDDRFYTVLLFVLLEPTDPWCPRIPAQDYFLSAAHGEPLPKDSFIHGLRALVEAPSDQLASQFRSLALRHPQVFLSYNFLQTHSRILRQKEIAESLA